MLRSITDHCSTIRSKVARPLPLLLLLHPIPAVWNSAQKWYLHSKDNPQLQAFFFLHVVCGCCQKSSRAAVKPNAVRPHSRSRSPTRLARNARWMSATYPPDAGPPALCVCVCSEDNRSNYLIIVTLADFRFFCSTADCLSSCHLLFFPEQFSFFFVFFRLNPLGCGYTMQFSPRQVLPSHKVSNFTQRVCAHKEVLESVPHLHFFFSQYVQVRLVYPLYE